MLHDPHLTDEEADGFMAALAEVRALDRTSELEAEVDLLRAALGYALPTIGCGATYEKIEKLLGYPEQDELDEYEARFLALTDG